MATQIGGAALRSRRQTTPPRKVGGPVLRVKLVTSGQVEGGPAMPVYYVQASELVQNGGPFRLLGNTPIPIREDASAPTTGGPAIPVFLV